MPHQFNDKFSHILTLPDAQWKHIIEQHPEVEPYRERLADVLKSPDFVKKSKKDINTFLYYKYYNDIYQGKYLLVVADTALQKEVLTCYSKSH